MLAILLGSEGLDILQISWAKQRRRSYMYISKGLYYLKIIDFVELANGPAPFLLNIVPANIYSIEQVIAKIIPFILIHPFPNRLKFVHVSVNNSNAKVAFFKINYYWL